jgi:putative thiamine transport system ATP-binding protein
MTVTNSSLQIQNLCIYQDKKPLLQLNEVVAPGEILTIMGPSGSGKSTLLNWLLGMLAPVFSATGTLHINGQDLTHTPSHLRNIGLLFQDPLLFNHLSVSGNIEFGMRKLKSDDKQQRVADALKSVGLSDMQNRAPSSLSGGQQARVALLRVLLNEPKVVLLDEPFSKLDSELRQTTRELVFDQIRRRNVPAILVTHDKSDAAAAMGKIINLADKASTTAC